MTECPVTRWRELPSTVAARAGTRSSKLELASRLQETVGEAEIRLGDTGDDYLMDRERTPESMADGTPAEMLEGVASEPDAEWPADGLAEYLSGRGR